MGADATLRKWTSQTAMMRLKGQPRRSAARGKRNWPAADSLPEPLLRAPGHRPQGRGDQDLQGLRALTRLMDEALAVPGTRLRVGLDSLLGLLPGVGDVAGAAVSGYALLVALRLGAPLPVLLRMLLNIGVDTAVGAVPLLGDLFDLGWKANRRNLRLLEQYLERPATTKRTSLGVVAAAVALFLLLLSGAAWLVAALVRLILT